MSMNKKKSILALLLIVIMTLVACGPRFYVHKYTINTSYKKWVKEIGLFSHEDLRVHKYKEDGNKIIMELEYENGLAGYKELCEVVNAHNKFVDENPEYFSDDIDILIINTSPNEYVPSTFFNHKSDELCDYSILGRQDTAKLQYMIIDVEGANTETMKSDEIIIDVPVIIMECSYIPARDKYDFLSEFQNAEQVVMDFGEMNSKDKSEVCEYIREQVSGVEIYNTINEKYQDHLEKCE